jgi:hypothetical protein
MSPIGHKADVLIERDRQIAHALSGGVMGRMVTKEQR